MATQAEQRLYNSDQKAGMRPTNSQVGGPGALGSGPAQDQRRSDNDDFNAGGANTQGEYADQQQQQGPPPPQHPDQTGQTAQYGQVQGQGNYADQNQNTNLQPGQGTTGTRHHTTDANRAGEAGTAKEGEKLVHEGQGYGRSGRNNGQHEQNVGGVTGQYDQHLDQSGNQGLTDREHHASGAARVAEGGAAYEGAKFAHGGHGPETHGTQRLHGQHDEHANQNQGTTGGGHHSGGATRAMEGGAAYEGGKPAHEAGAQGHHEDRLTGHHDGYDDNAANVDSPGYGTGTGAGAGATGSGAGAGHPAGQTGAGTGLGTGAAAGGAAGAAHHGIGQGVGQGAGTYTSAKAGQGVGTGATGAGTNTGVGPDESTGTGLGTNSTSSGQPHVILGKLQQAGGILLGDDSIMAKGLEREAHGVARADQQEAERLEGMAAIRREKAGGVHAGGGPGSATAGVDPTAGTHGRNL